MAKRYEFSNEAWDVVSDGFIEGHGRGRPPLSDRLMIDGMLWVLCSGAAWRVLQLPEGQALHDTDECITGTGAAQFQSITVIVDVDPQHRLEDMGHGPVPLHRGHSDLSPVHRRCACPAVVASCPFSHQVWKTEVNFLEAYKDHAIYGHEHSGIRVESIFVLTENTKDEIPWLRCSNYSSIPRSMDD